MIKIINGTYGMRKNFKVMPVKKGDAPISLDPAEEKRLVSIGVAEYVTDVKDSDNSNAKLQKLPPAVKQEGKDEVKSFDNFKINELKEYAVSLGIEVPKSAKSKKAVIALIEAAENAENGKSNGNVNNDPDAPNLSAQMPT